MMNSLSALGSYFLGANQPTGRADLSSLRQQWMEQLFKRADSDQDGKLTLKEFTSAYAQFQSQAGGSAKLPSAEDLFKAADADSDGIVSKQEFVDALQQLYGQAQDVSGQGSATGESLSAQQASAKAMLLSLQQGLGLEQYLGSSNSSGSSALADEIPGPVLSPTMQVMAENINASNTSVEALLGLPNDGSLEQLMQAKSSESVLDFMA
jgi:hypothetical protein